ncbi:MAG TPA: sel1 repeat family protein [Gammaproteobacteria bacterium]|nr:sel1 repeat family protein [Gammaproteobacteria bacterium]
MPYSVHVGQFPRCCMLATVFLLSFSAAPPVFALWDEMLAEQMEEAEAGDADAQYEVGIKYLKGHGVEQDTSRALHWLELSAQSGNERARTKLQRMQDQQAKFSDTLKKAQSGDAGAQYTVGMMYLKGKGTAQDGAKARDWISKAARQNNQKAITRLGILYFKGEGGSVDYPRALELFQSVSSDSVLAQYYLGEMYAAGKGVDRNFNTAIDWYRKAVDGGFKRAGGKIINMEEELRMAGRRKSNAVSVEAPEPAAKKAVSKPVPKQAKAGPAPVAKPKKAKKTQKARKAKKAPVPRPATLTALEKLAKRHWVRSQKPVDYLPSKVTLCEIEGEELVCFSKVLKRTQGAREVEYRVKSEIREQRGKIMITYRNLVLDVVDTQVDEDEQPLGYDDEVDQGFQVKTGWTQDHQVECSKPKRGKLNCLKDQTHKMSIVEG